MIDLDQALKESAGAAPAQAEIVKRPLWKRAAPALATLVFGALAAGAAMWGIRPASPAPIVTRFAFTLGEGQVFTNTGRNVVAISPDGTQIVYVANLRLYLRRMGELEAKVIPGSENPIGILNPVFSPDGGSFAFFSAADSAIKRIDASGGAAISLCPAGLPFGMNWSEDGILFGQSSGIMRVSANGGKPETLVTLKSEETATAPQLLPGGKAVLFSLATGTAQDRWDKAKVVVQTIGSAERKVLIAGGSEGHYLPTGQIVYAFSGTLRAVPFDLKRLEVTGGPVPVIEGVRRSVGSAATGVAQFSFSSNGSLAYIPGPVSPLTSSTSLAFIDREGHAEPLKIQPGSYGVPRVSPNGKLVAFQTDDEDGIIWIYDLSGATAPRRLTFGGKNRSPVWSPDGKWVAFQSDREGDLAIFQQKADGSGTAERLTKADAGTAHVPDSWSPDGNILLFEVRKGSAAASLWTLSIHDKKVARFGNVENVDQIDAIFSPDGRWVAYTSGDISAKGAVFVQPFPAPGAKYQIPGSLGNHASVWSPDGKELFFTPGPNQFEAVSIAVQPSFAIGNSAVVFKGAPSNAPWVQRTYDIMPDGKRMLAVIAAGQDPGVTPQIEVVLNWFEELKQRVPVK